jgi:hypothetical protein
MVDVLKLNYAISRLENFVQRKRRREAKGHRKSLAVSLGQDSGNLLLQDEQLLTLHRQNSLDGIRTASMAHIGPVNAHTDSQRAEIQKATGKGGKPKPRRRSSAKGRELRTMRHSMHEGDTMMQGPLNKMSSGLYKRWQERYFALRGHYLKYFPDEQKACVKGVWDMDDLHSCTMPEETTILLTFEGNTKLQLNAADEQTARLWHANFSEHVEKNKVGHRSPPAKAGDGSLEDGEEADPDEERKTDLEWEKHEAEAEMHDAKLAEKAEKEREKAKKLAEKDAAKEKAKKEKEEKMQAKQKAKVDTKAEKQRRQSMVMEATEAKKGKGAAGESPGKLP